VFIHVVQAGETVWRIALQYGVSIAAITQTNLLSSSNIVPGQTLLIPVGMRSYIVMPSDTLHRIANRYHVSVNELLTMNSKIHSMAISAGDIIQFPVISRPRKTVLGFLELIQPKVDEVNVQSFGPYFTYIALFTYGMTGTGAITPVEDEAALQSFVNTKAVPVAVFSNWTGDNFSRGAVRMLLSKPSIRQQYISEGLKIVSKRGYRAVVIDFESLHPQDGKLFIEFLKELSVRLQPLKIPSIVCVMPIIGQYSFEKPMIQAYDYNAIAQHANFIMLMSYNWSWPGGPPGAVAPFARVEENIRYALSQMPRKQILLGLIRYGYDFALPFRKGEFAGTIEVQVVVEMAMQKEIPIQFDRQSLTPSIRYRDNQGRQHVIWYENARSLQLKLQLVQKYRLAGIAAWELSQRFPQFTHLVLDNFQIQ
jgi:spore germination protein